MPKRRVKRMVGSFGFPAEVVLGGVCVVLYAGFGCAVQNAQGVITYQESLIRVNTASGMLRIEGHGLCIEELGKKELNITGKIISATFEEI